MYNLIVKTFDNRFSAQITARYDISTKCKYEIQELVIKTKCDIEDNVFKFCDARDMFSFLSELSNIFSQLEII